MASKHEISDILKKLGRGETLSSSEIDILSDAIASSRSYSGSGSNALDNTNIRIEELTEILKKENEINKIREKYKDDLDKINEKLENGTKLTHKELKIAKEYQKVLRENRKEKEEEEELSRKIVELEDRIDKKFEEQNRYLDKQLEFRRLEVKSITEGLTWEERRKKVLGEIGETIGINTNKLKNGFSEIKNGISELKTAIKDINEPWGKVDQAAADFTKRIGGSAESMEKLRKTTIDFMETRSIGIKYNTSMEELIKLQSDYNASLGRSVSLTNDQKETFAAMKSVVGEQTALDFTTKLENFGLNPDEVGDRVGEMFQKASKSGIAFEKYSKNFLDNIKLAQNYNFQNGLRGLDAMAKKATAIKLDMQQTANFANKVSTLEGATQAGAQLSVLGGDFARYGNPLSMMYEGLNDMEGLQDRVINMFGKMGKWDYSKGQVDVSVYNKQRIKAAAEATGMDYSSLMESINANARRNIVEGKIGSKFDNDEELKELVLNKAQLDKEGNAFVTINGEKKSVNEITEDDRSALRTENNSDSDNIREIAFNTRGYKDITEGFDKQKEASSAQVNESLHIGETTKKILTSVGENVKMMRVLATASTLLNGVNAALGVLNGTAIMIASLIKTNGKIGGIANGKMSNTGGINGGNGTTYGKTWNGQTTRTLKNGTQQVFNPSKVGKGSNGWVNMSRGTKFMNGVGKYGTAGGAIAGAVGGLVDVGTDLAYANKKKDNGYVAGKTIGKGLEFAGNGAMIGSMFGPIGTLVGAGVGLVGGAIYGGISAHAEKVKEEKADVLRANYHGVINDPSVYTEDELDSMLLGGKEVPYNLKQKMLSNNDYLDGFKNGGYTGSGNVNEVAGVVHKGEIVLPNESIKESVSPNGNLMNELKVTSNKTETNEQSSNKQTLSFEPLNINISGTLNLNANGANVKQLEAKDVMTPEIIDEIIKQIQIRTNYGLDRDKTHIKYG